MKTVQLSLYPSGNDYPFDKVVCDIVKQLEKKKFKLKNYNVDFGKISDNLIYVRKITGSDFILLFERLLGRQNNSFYNTTGVSELRIPGKVLEVYGEVSGLSSPLYYENKGNSWLTDLSKNPYSFNELFIKFNASASPDASGINDNIGGLKPYLVESVITGVPRVLETSNIMQEFTHFLENKLKEIM